MTLTIPGHVMANIVSYMSFDDLAKMAQVSRAWRTYAYGNPLWYNANWEPQARATNDFCDSNNIVPDARHIGIPTQLCFLSWALQQSRSNSIEQACDPVEYTDHLKREWLAKKRPCIHRTHHQWRDVFKARGLLHGLPYYESCRLEFLLITYPRGDAQNRVWLERRIAECSSLPFPPPALLTIPFSARENTDILEALRQKYRTMNLERYTYIVGRLQRLVNLYQESADSLGRRGPMPELSGLFGLSELSGLSGLSGLKAGVVEALTDAIAFSCPPYHIDPIE